MPESPRAVQVQDLSVRFGDFTAVKKISFAVPTGEIFGFLGANGAGKTTTIRVLCGILAPSEGEVEVAGQKITDARSLREIKKRVGYMSQKFTLYDDLSVAENLQFAADLRKMDEALFRRRRGELLDFIDFRQKPATMVRDLPGGIKQQVSLVAAVLHDPEVIFLDEPTAGVTPASRARFWKLIRSLTDQGKTVFVTTHYMDEAEQCGRVALMSAGQLVALDSPARLKSRCFPRGLLELTPKTGEDIAALEKEAKNAAFSLFEPYGRRFHVEIRDEAAWRSLETEFRKRAAIREVPPSLEDVFIRLVEGGR